MESKTNNPAISVRAYVKYKIERILESQSDHAVRAGLANLRRGIGRIPGDMPELWGTIFDGYSSISESRESVPMPTREEWAIYIALTSFALHQQGHDVKREPMSKDGASFGSAVRQLVPVGDEDALERIRKRFNLVASASDMTELSYHMRGIVQLLRGAERPIPIDYPAFAADIYYFQNPQSAQSVRLKWGRDFYRVSTEKQNDEASENTVD